MKKLFFALLLYLALVLMASVSVAQWSNVFRPVNPFDTHPFGTEPFSNMADTPPPGYDYLVDSDNAYFLDSVGAYVCVPQ